MSFFRKHLCPRCGEPYDVESLHFWWTCPKLPHNVPKIPDNLNEQLEAAERPKFTLIRGGKYEKT